MSDDDFKFEPIRGLPEALPKDEHIIWQGSPKPWRLARESLLIHWVIGYFALLVVWRVGVSSTFVPFGEALGHGLPLVLIGAVAVLLLWGFAAMQARCAVYTLTNKRVAMRIGAAMTMTLNLPYSQIASANLDLRKGGTGTLAFELMGTTQFSYAMTWPHVRPWKMKPTQPALRCIPDAQAVAALFAEAAETRLSEPQLERVAPGAAVAAE